MSSLRLALKQSLAETAAQQQEQERKKREEEERRRKEKRRRQRARQEQRRRDEDRKRRRMQRLRRAQQESLAGMNVGSGGRSVSSSTLTSSGSSSSSSSSSSSGSDGSASDGSSSAASRKDGRGRGRFDHESSNGSDDGSSSDEASVSSSSSSSSSDEVEMEGVFDSEVSSDDENDDARRSKKKKQAQEQQHQREQQLTKSSPSDPRNFPEDNNQAQWKKKKKKKSSPESKTKAGGSKGSGSNKKPSTGTSGTSAQQTTTPPAPEIIAWMKNMSVGKQRQNMVAGLRVKVRFVTKSNKRGKDGKPLRRLKWYGGLVTEVSTSGKKIRIKYDDGTSEVADFPDKDIVVDDEDNKRHKHGVSADAFVPPPPSLPPEQKSPMPHSSSRSQSPAESERKSDKQQQRSHSRSTSSPSPVRQQQDEEMRTPPLPKISSEKPNPDDERTPALESQTQSRPTPGSAKPSAVSESPFSPPHNVLSPSSSSSSGSGSERSGSSDAGGKLKPRRMRKRSRSPLPTAMVPKDSSVVEHADGGEAERRPAGLDKPNTTLHIKLKPPKSKKAVAIGESGAPNDISPRPPRKVDDDAGYFPSDGEELEPKRGDRFRRKSGSPPEGEFEWMDDTGGGSSRKKDAAERKLSGKKRSSPVLSDSSDEHPPRKRPMAVPLTPKDQGGPADEGDGMSREERNPVKTAGLASESTAFTTYAESISEKTTLLSDEREGVPSPEGDAASQRNKGGEGDLAGNKEVLRIKVSRDLARSESATASVTERKSPRPPSVASSGRSKKKRSREERERSKSPMRRDSGGPRSPRNRRDGETYSEVSPGTRRGSNSSRSDLSPPSDEPMGCSRDEKDSSDSESDGQRHKATGLRSSLVPPSCVEPSSNETKSDVKAANKSTTTISIPVPRSGRRAAQKANERIKERKEIVIKDEFIIKPKKKKEKPDLKLFPAPGSFEDDDESEDEGEKDRWVQCDRCEKWRLLPSSVEMEKLPDRWYCELNIYDPKRNNCGAPEQTAKEIEKEKLAKKARKALAAASSGRSMSPEDGAVENEVATGTKHDAESVKKSSPVHCSADVEMRQLSESPMQDETTKDADGLESEMTSALSNLKEGAVQETLDELDEEPDQNRTEALVEFKEGLSAGSSVGMGKKVKLTGEDAVSTAASDTASDIVSPPRPKGSFRSRNRNRDRDRDRDRRERDSGREKSSKGGKGSKEKNEADSQEWVQCEKCEKWRRLPPRISAEDLPEIWYCSMNTWDMNSASCDVEEDKVDSAQREYTIFSAANNGISSSFGNSGKLSYRNLIFGNGRKQHRPVSERTRAAESLFPTQPSDPSVEGGGPPTVMYANSSAFVCKGMSSQKSGTLEENNRVSFLDLMSQSQLWAELYHGAQAIQALSCGRAGYPYVDQTPNGTSNESSALLMKSLVQNALGTKTLAGHEVLLEAQCRQWEDGQWSKLRATCTIDNVTHALEELVKDGVLEVVPSRELDGAGISAVRYRRVAACRDEVPKGGNRSKRAKSSRCIKKKWLDRARSNVENQRCS